MLRIVLVLGMAGVSTFGCNTAAFLEAMAGVQFAPNSAQGSCDLIVKVSYAGKPIPGVLVRVLETGAHASTNANGVTPPLWVESTAQRVTIFAKYGELETTRFIHLHRGLNEVEIGL
ncbi:MAG: hypothetical protein FJY73_13100 [Candidatus Eisenbacteria bacterium]|nr:hypothetical protein [Candidatus Eisenbacteria bacterium]